MSKLISIIVPVFNVEKYLKRCIDSILKQTYSNIEVILVDDGSKDNSGVICDEFAQKDNRIKVIHKENGGMSDARNHGLKIAKGDYVGFVDSDDYIEEDMYETLINLCETNNANISVISIYNVENGKITKCDYSNKVTILNTNEALKQLLLDDKITNHVFSKLYKRELFYNILFPFQKAFEDIDVTYRLFMNSKTIVFLDTPQYYYIRRPDSITKNKTYENYKDFVGLLISRYNVIKSIFNDESILKYNAYGLVNSMLWFYTVISSFNIPELESDFQKTYELLKKETKQYNDFFSEHMNDYNKKILSLMMNDSKNSRENVKKIYFKNMEES